jgi:hypothetical protein
MTPTLRTYVLVWISAVTFCEVVDLLQEVLK